jgi:hypothetical protein
VVSDGSVGTRQFTLFPLIRWNRALTEHGLRVRIFHELQGRALECDVLVVCSKYFRAWQNIQTRSPDNEQQLRETLERLRAPGRIVAWFDLSDPGGSTDFGVIDLVDVFLKKQLWSDRAGYASRLACAVRPWLAGAAPEADAGRSGHEYRPCPVEHLGKLRVAWNIGLGDFRYVCWGFNRIGHRTPEFPRLRFTEASTARRMDLSFRGTVNYDGGNGVGAHRQQVHQAMTPLRERGYRLAMGGRLSRRQYLRELRTSKLAVSPFGWGEICFRDFEIVAAGAALVKPTVDHLDTWPPFFEPNVTYVPLAWDLADGRAMVTSMLAAPKERLAIAAAAQSRLRAYHARGDASGAAFAAHVSRALNSDAAR